MDRHTNTHRETKSKYFDGHGRLSQSEESECMWAHDKDGVTRVLSCTHTHSLSSDWERWSSPSKYFDFVSVCLCACPPWSLQFLVRVLTFFSLILNNNNWLWIILGVNLYYEVNGLTEFNLLIHIISIAEN